MVLSPPPARSRFDPFAIVRCLLARGIVDRLAFPRRVLADL
jgi:hypothetical protein